MDMSDVTAAWVQRVGVLAVGGDDSANDVAWFTGEAWTNAWTNTTHVRSDETDRRPREMRRTRLAEERRTERGKERRGGRKQRESHESHGECGRMRTNADECGRMRTEGDSHSPDDVREAPIARPRRTRYVRITMITMFATTTMTIGDAGNATLPEELPCPVQPRSLSARN